MKLFEYMAKDIFKAAGITVPKGLVAENPEEVKKAAISLGGEVVIKSQVLTGGRGKAGGIKFSSDPLNALELGKQLFAKKINGYQVEKVLVEEKIAIDHELYLAIISDGTSKNPLLIASASGGMDIEEVPEADIVKLSIDIRYGIYPFLAREVSRRLGLKGNQAKAMAKLIVTLYEVYKDYDAELVEINPLVISGDTLLAADGKFNIDDEASFRYPSNLPRVEEGTERELKARELGISYVELEGDIAVMANGAGITMATLDTIQHYGGKPMNFMDAGGGSSEEATTKALEILLSTGPKGILINIFGGITRCDDVARAFVNVKEKLGISIPVVIRLVGTNEEKGLEILNSVGVEAYKTMEEAARKIVELVQLQEVGI